MKDMTQAVWFGLLAAGATTVAWIALGFAGSNTVALLMTLLIGAVFGLGAWEVWRFRSQTVALQLALHRLPSPLADLSAWLQTLPQPLQAGVQGRISTGRTPLPGLALTPYLVGLLVMLGMLGTFLGMVVTFKGALFALEGSTDLQTIRSALAAPIKGLGLSFGTSVAGVATSALLGMMSALCRRERTAVVGEFDARLITDFRPFTQAHHRDQAYLALQEQARLLPDVVGQLKTLVQQMEQRNQQVSEQMLAGQTAFHAEVSVAYRALAQSVSSALQDSLSTSARQAGEQLQPLLEQAVSRMATDARSQYTELQTLTAEQLQTVLAKLAVTTDAVSAHWRQALDEQGATQAAWSRQLETALGQFTAGFDERSQAWLASTAESHRQAIQAQRVADEARQASWNEAVESWQRLQQQAAKSQGEHALAQQQAVCDRLDHTAQAWMEKWDENAVQRTDQLNLLLQSAEEAMRQRLAADTRAATLHDERMAQLTAAWQAGLAALREDERARSQAALDSMGALQTALQAQLASQLATLGTALEAPMSRLMHTAAEVPQAAASLLAELRADRASLNERDNHALDERRELMTQMHNLLQGLNQVTVQQRAAVDALVAGAADALAVAAGRFTESLSGQTQQAEAVAAHAQASAIELASLGEAFQQGVAQFSSTHDKLVEGLQRVEAALRQTTARSDEQMAYYVAQAREVIDLSLASQQGIMDDLMRLRGAPQPADAEVAA